MRVIHVADYGGPYAGSFVPMLRAVATRVSAFSNGRTLVEGDADTVFESPDVQRVFLRGVRDA